VQPALPDVPTLADSRQDELPLETYRHLAREFEQLGVHQISIAGGEPLLRADVFRIIEGFAERGMSVNSAPTGCWSRNTGVKSPTAAQPV